MAEVPRTNTSEIWVTKLKDIFYRPQYQARALYEIMSPDLIFDEMWPHIPTPDLAVNIPKKTASGTRFSDSSDARKTYAPPWRPGADITVDTITPGEWESHTLKTYARAFVVDLAAASNPMQMQWIADTRKRIGLWMREQINADVVKAVTNDFSVTTTTDVAAIADKFEHIASDVGYEDTKGFLAGVIDSANFWDEGGADPVTDVMDLDTAFGDQDGYPFELTDLYMTKNAANMFSKFVVRAGGKWAKDPTGSGYITDQVAGVAFHALKGDTSGWDVTAGDDFVMGLDRNWPCAETYYFTYSKLPTVGGFMNYDFWNDKATKTDHYEFMFTRRTILREPRALCILQVRD
jgi:hypothetical protein